MVQGAKGGKGERSALLPFAPLHSLRSPSLPFGPLCSPSPPFAPLHSLRSPSLPEHYKYSCTVKTLHLSFDLHRGNIYVKMVQGAKGGKGERSALLPFAPLRPPSLPLLPFTPLQPPLLPFSPFCYFTPCLHTEVVGTLKPSIEYASLPLLPFTPLRSPFAPLCPLCSPLLPFTPFSHRGGGDPKT